MNGTSAAPDPAGGALARLGGSMVNRVAGQIAVSSTMSIYRAGGERGSKSRSIAPSFRRG
ncbi:hypothetical protein [Glacieibacterium sp.]|uniref:hypothetical protein n=1 Tax=Glacieibacterium sp. TaxID=2860237 RepID=UPI003AFFFE8C